MIRCNILSWNRYHLIEYKLVRRWICPKIRDWESVVSLSICRIPWLYRHAYVEGRKWLLSKVRIWEFEPVSRDRTSSHCIYKLLQIGEMWIVRITFSLPCLLFVNKCMHNMRKSKIRVTYSSELLVTIGGDIYEFGNSWNMRLHVLIYILSFDPSIKRLFNSKNE